MRLDAPALRALLAERGIDPDREIVAYCHSGQRSALAAGALRSAGLAAANYEGSWHESVAARLTRRPLSRARRAVGTRRTRPAAPLDGVGQLEQLPFGERPRDELPQPDRQARRGEAARTDRAGQHITVTREHARIHST